MEKRKDGGLRALACRLLGGLRMSWPAVILLALGTAVVTALFLLLPVFRNTSFERMGVTFEAWIFFAVLIMANCSTPLESALKTFVFFLISQPLIYLLQVPFSSIGWRLFGYYPFWFGLTLATFPAAWVGWHLTRRDWLSLLILSPALCFLGMTCAEAFRSAALHFPRLLVTGLFCLGQILLYLLAFTSTRGQKLAGLAFALAVTGVFLLNSSRLDISGTLFLPDNPVLTDAAVVEMADTDIADVTIESTGEDSMVRVHSHRYGVFPMVIRDGEKEYRYTVEIYEDDGGHSQTRITPQ